MFKHNNIISHNIAISVRYVTRTYACTTYDRLAIPLAYNTAYETSIWQ